MGRLFLTEREINLINDLAKELVKDVVGQKIYYFSISNIKSQVHDVYEESPDKIFENPIEIDALVKYSPQDVRTNRFGSEEYYSIECYLQFRDLLDKGISVSEGDFFSYGTTFFEVIKAPRTDVIFGQIEHKSYITITGKQSRKGQFISKVFGPTSEEYSDSDAVQTTLRSTARICREQTRSHSEISGSCKRKAFSMRLSQDLQRSLRVEILKASGLHSTMRAEHA